MVHCTHNCIAYYDYCILYNKISSVVLLYQHFIGFISVEELGNPGLLVKCSGLMVDVTLFIFK